VQVEQPRNCVFVGTTNKDAYLQDETGNRRFWPVKVVEVDLSGLARDRDQLLAEAVHLFRNGVQWWPTKDMERKLFVAEQEARMDNSDVWVEAIASWLSNLADHRGVTIKRIASDVLSIETNRASRADSLRISRILETLGWARGELRGGFPTWVPGPKWIDRLNRTLFD
jgi:predicted P-loop ATPase